MINTNLRWQTQSGSTTSQHPWVICFQFMSINVHVTLLALWSCHLTHWGQDKITVILHGLTLNRQQFIIGNNDGLVFWCIYTSLCLNEVTLHWPLKCQKFVKISLTIFDHFVWNGNIYQNQWNKLLTKINSKSATRILPTANLASLGADTYACTIMNKFGFPCGASKSTLSCHWLKANNSIATSVPYHFQNYGLKFDTCYCGCFIEIMSFTVMLTTNVDWWWQRKQNSIVCELHLYFFCV